MRITSYNNQIRRIMFFAGQSAQRANAFAQDLVRAFQNRVLPLGPLQALRFFRRSHGGSRNLGSLACQAESRGARQASQVRIWPLGHLAALAPRSRGLASVV